jgi:acyl-CoA reductase-like NAD-dependent aldehyde dehydrogenase
VPASQGAEAPTLKKLSLELGGKSCFLVFKDAYIDRIAPRLAAAATVISGQLCTAARRVLLHASYHEAVKSWPLRWQPSGWRSAMPRVRRWVP